MGTPEGTAPTPSGFGDFSAGPQWLQLPQPPIPGGRAFDPNDAAGASKDGI